MDKKILNKVLNGKWKDGYLGALLRMLPAMLMAGLVPLVVYQYEYDPGLIQYPWFNILDFSVEFFLASKAVVLTVLMFVMTLLIVARIIIKKGKVPFVPLYMPLLVYGFLAFLSACFSINRKFSFWGSYEQFESIWVLLGYVLVVYYVVLFAQGQKELQVVVDAVCFVTTAVGTIGMFQGIGIDPFKTKFVQKLMTTDEFLEMVGGELIIQSGENQAFATLYNSNYLGVFGSLVLPFLVLLILFDKSVWRRIWHCANVIIVMVALISSRSRAGLIAAGIALLVVLLFSIRKVMKWWFIAIPAINLAVVILLLVNAYNDNVIFERLENIFPKDNTEYEEIMTEEGQVVRKTGLTEMQTAPGGVILTYNEARVQISLFSDGYSYGVYALNEQSEQVGMVSDETGSVFTFENPALADVKVEPAFIGDNLGLCITAEKEWYFFYDAEKQKYQYITDFGKASDMIMAESYGLENRQKIFSGRGYIWSRTIPLLKDHIFLGSGPDTFLLEFPQEDYVMMRKNGYENAVMTKPHSMYLQIGVQTGVLSLVCILVFYIWYAVQSIKLYAFRKLGTQVEAFGMAAFIGSIGYMISGISNDSMVVTAPVFWGMIGLGVAANVMVQKARKEEAALMPVAVSTVPETVAEAKEEAVSTENETTSVKEAEKEEVKDNASENVKKKEPAKKQTAGNKKKKR